MKGNYCKFNQEVSPIAAAIPDVLSLVEQIKVASGMCYDPQIAFFSISLRKGDQKRFPFT